MKNKVVLITGASRGIGRKLAVSFVDAGCFVIINFLSNKPQAEETLSLIEKAGGRGRLIKADVSDSDSAREIVSDIAKTEQPLRAAGVDQRRLVHDLLMRLVGIGHGAQIGVEPAAYLNGLAEAIGESRRHVLDVIRKGDLVRGERILNIMDEVYYALITFDYPDAVTQGLRRQTDMVRGVLERTRGDITMSFQQKRLEDAIQEYLRHEPGAGRDS